MRFVFMVGCLFMIAVAAGCAGSSELRTDSSTSAIRAAEAVGAADVPRAQLHLQYAREALERAKRMSDEGDDEEAASMLLRAGADAELAVVLSQEQNEKVEAEAAMERVRELQRNNR